jgi:hypothetical protein
MDRAKNNPQITIAITIESKSPNTDLDPWADPNYDPWEGLSPDQRVMAFYEEFYPTN